VNPLVLKEMLRIPHSTIKLFSGKGVDASKVQKMFHKPAASKNVFVHDEAEDISRDIGECPKAAALSRVDKAYFRAAVVARQRGLKPSGKTDPAIDCVIKNKAVIDVATSLAERMLKCIAISRTNGLQGRLITDKNFDEMNKFGKNPILGNTAI
jgi:hypothetical protein